MTQSTPSIAVHRRVAHLRRAYFALVRDLGLDAETRHSMNESLTGHESTKDFSLADWSKVVAKLQMDNGQPAAPDRPLLRAEPVERPAPQYELDADGNLVQAPESASIAQIEAIENLAARLRWSKSAEHFVRARVLAPQRQMNWNGRWDALTRAEATTVITVMRKMH